MADKFTIEEVQLADLSPKEMEMVGSGNGARYLRFKHATLARAEKNKNQDRITPGGIDELAGHPCRNAD